MHILYLHDRAVDALLIKALREIGHVVDVLDGPLDGAPTGSGYDVMVADLWREPTAQVQALATPAGAGLVVAVVSAGLSAADRAEVLRAGADLCFARPVDIREFNARLRAIAKVGERQRIAPQARSELEWLRDGRTLRLGQREVSLSQREFQLLVYLAQRPRQVVRAEDLLRHVWGEETDTQPHALARAMRRLRQKLLEAVGDPLVEIVRGHGYALRQDKPAG
jgi:OmpR-family two-component system manganese-sensing response regulator